MSNKIIAKITILFSVFLIVFLLISGFSEIAHFQKSSILNAETNLIHGVVPAKVTAHGSGTESSNTTYDWYFEFFNVGKIGGDQYAKAKLTWVSTLQDQGGGSRTSVYDGEFSGGPNGDITINIGGSQFTFDLREGKNIYGGGNFTNGGVAAVVDNPDAFNGWDDEETSVEKSKPTIKLVLLGDPVDMADGKVKYKVKALVTGNPAPVVEFFRDPQSSISSTDTKNVIEVVAGKNEALALTATATNSEGSATASLGFPPPTIELIIVEGPTENTDKTVTYIIGAKITGTPEPVVEFSADDPKKVTAIDNLNVKVTLNPGDNITIEAKATNEFGQDDARIELSALEKTKPMLDLSVLAGPTADENGNYSYVVEVKVQGFPEPVVKFNRDDSNGSLGKNITTITLAEGEKFILTATAENSEGKEEKSIELSAPYIPKIKLEIIKGPVYVNLRYAYYILEAVVEGYPEPYVVWENPSNTVFGQYGKNKRIVYIREDETGELSNIVINAYAMNGIGKSEKKSVNLSWQAPPEGYFKKRTITVFEGEVKGKLLIKKADQKDFKAVSGSVTLQAGDTVKTLDNSSVIVVSSFKGFAILDKGTEFIVKADEDGNQFILEKGKMKVELPKGSNYSFQGTHGTANIKGTTFIFSSDDNETDLKVIDGKVEFVSSGSGESVEINSGESIKAKGDGLEEKSGFDINAENNYWNTLEADNENPETLSSVGNFLFNFQQRLNEAGISDALILVIGIGIIVIIISAVVLIVVLTRNKT